MPDKYSDIDNAKTYLRGQGYDKEKIKDLFTTLEDGSQFGYAAEVILKYISEIEENGDEPLDDNYYTLVRNIYKDTSLSSYFKFDKAINILKSACGVEKSDSCETLGLAGAIFKYKWKFDHQIQNLYKSLMYYKKGYGVWNTHIKVSKETDLGYTAINYAFVSELLSTQFLGQLGMSDSVSEESVSGYQNAQKIRMQVLETYITDIEATAPQTKQPVTKPFHYATLAEAFFGLRKYKQALVFIEEYIKHQEFKWRVQTFSQQMYQIADLQNSEKQFSAQNNDCFNAGEIDLELQQQCLLMLEGGNKIRDKKPIARNYTQKKGLALSGGGFRAALFEIGILTALAEADELRDVEVISCVSGGSIIGTYYYLHLKKLLEANEDAEITKADYINMVKIIETDFLKAVQNNLRMRLFTNMFQNFKMVFSKTYSRSYRLGYLYQKYFYLPLYNKDKKTEDQRKDLFMSDLIISPKGTTDFNISQHNWDRVNKVPQLILNSTCLNTGHNWQFTSTWMGEPPTYLSKNFDVKKRLRRMYYKDAPAGYKNFPVGNAVAASSCVPVLFEPLVLKDLYPGIDVELVDGGVHDNQGIASILEQECDCVYVCDGSSQLPDNASTTSNEFALFFRVDNVAQERVRETQLLDLKARRYSSIIRNLKIMHLKNELTQEPLSWIDCDDEPRQILQQHVKHDDALLDFGIMKHVQQLLSEVRTDLDSFNDMEAYALMYSGYRQTISAFKPDMKGITSDWKFLQVADYCTEPSQKKPMVNQLKISASVAFKLVKRYSILKVLLYALGLVIAVGLIALAVYYRDRNISVKWLAITIGLFGIGLFSRFLAKLLDIKGYVKKQLFLIAAAAFGWLVFNLYVWIFNPWYNMSGRIKKK